jgi:hypothetical protein
LPVFAVNLDVLGNPIRHFPQIPRRNPEDKK